ncbi:protein Turandot B [Drosophila mauritiana]|uniref:Protein Turandot B n=1 Tax=Drosophila mauritiana TaxID=7226 RepID=A0A6P8KHX1_DROMA|nr:protein Turandot B [Drosophila mauritiana]
MNFKTALICFALLLIGTLCSAYSNQERQRDSRRVAEIMRTSLDDNTKINRIQELLTIYNRMAPSLRPDERARIDRFISRHTEGIMVDGVPSQGGARKIFKKTLSPAAKSVATGFFTELGASLASLFTSWFPATTTERNH